MATIFPLQYQRIFYIHLYYISRWFHKPCTKLMKFTEKFSCRSVKMKCLEAPPLPAKPPAPPKEPVIKRAVVKFKPDYPRLMMKNIHHRWNLQFLCLHKIFCRVATKLQKLSVFSCFFCFSNSKFCQLGWYIKVQIFDRFELSNVC